MHAIDFLRDPAKTPAKPVYAVFGDDAFLRREALVAITKQALGGVDDDLAVTRFAGEQTGLADVLDEVRTLPFFSKRKVVIVESADAFITAHRKGLESYVEHPSSAGTLVLSAKSWPSNTKLAKVLEKTGLAVDCKGANERVLATWLVHLAKSRFGTQLDDEASRLLLELVGPEVGLLVAEVDKLSVYVGKRAKIHRDDVAKMVGAGRVDDVWNVLGAATTGRGGLALELLDRLLASGEPPIKLLAAIRFSLCKVHHAGQLRRAGLDLKSACQKAGIFSNLVESTGQQHAHLGPRRVGQLPNILLKADLDLKGSSMLNPRAILEKLLVQLSRPRED